MRMERVVFRIWNEYSLTRDEVAAKSLDLMSPTLGAKRAQRVIDMVWGLEALPSLTTLATLLQGND